MFFLFAYAGVLNMIDGWLTYIGLSQGLIEESNPLMRSLFEANSHYLWGYKLVIGILAIVLGIFFKPKKPFFWRIALSFCCLLYTGIMGIHAFWLLQV
ncbi:DUF5658 family protein [Paenibacillus montanisoli]|uniref:DUF5658 domain-containing protein n=1 Tax=Paenibacillus montanisoli TaxID=2081970 RepID=A0A328TYB3_9BACL|nr:DUF5658 family protein [Paenibacillus montanisoli]RAP74742.1 hypothetical protein DL346_22140 [Paenibacillus montanisoli]